LDTELKHPGLGAASLNVEVESPVRDEPEKKNEPENKNEQENNGEPGNMPVEVVSSESSVAIESEQPQVMRGSNRRALERSEQIRQGQPDNSEDAVDEEEYTATQVILFSNEVALEENSKATSGLVDEIVLDENEIVLGEDEIVLDKGEISRDAETVLEIDDDEIVKFTVAEESDSDTDVSMDNRGGR